MAEIIKGSLVVKLRKTTNGELIAEHSDHHGLDKIILLNEDNSEIPIVGTFTLYLKQQENHGKAN